jgi:hypothetical protein
MELPAESVLTSLMATRLKPSDVGYKGKGVPSADTMARLQLEYAATVIASGLLPQDIMTKLARFRELAAMSADEATSKEAAWLAVELAPHLHFHVDEVDWED